MPSYTRINEKILLQTDEKKIEALLKDLLEKQRGKLDEIKVHTEDFEKEHGLGEESEK